MSPSRRALIAITSAHASLFEGGGHKTGVFIGEALHPYNIFKAAGFEVDIASEKGMWTEDWLSLQPGFLSEEKRKQYDDRSSDFRSEMDRNVKAGDLLEKEYSIFFSSTGHAALIEYPHATDLKKSLPKSGGMVASSPLSIFAGLLDPATGTPVIQGKKITGFTTQAEEEMGIMSGLRSWKEPLIDEHAKALGADYVRSEGIWDDYHIVDGRIVTGMNPQSAKSTAKAAIEVFEKR